MVRLFKETQVIKLQVLALESGISGGSISIFRDGLAMAGIQGQLTVSRAEDLLPNIDSLLQKAKVQADEIDVIAISVGPGSFTGLRIGISTAMGLAAALARPLVGVSLFDAIGAKLSRADPFVVAVPTGKSDICFQRISSTVGHPSVGTIEDFAAYLTSTEIDSIAVHSDLLTTRAGLLEVEGRRVIDLGTNMADYIALFASSQPKYLPVEPIYVQNPRFR